MTAKIVLALCILWAALASVVQVLVARGSGRTDYAVRRGNPLRGIIYNFTVAMTPAHKESVRRHPFKFVVGVVMHIGVLVCLLGVLLLLVGPSAGVGVLAWARPLAALSLLAGLYLLFRRCVDVNLRAMSCPDDYIAILAVCVLVAIVAFIPLGVIGQLVLLIYASVLFIYFPLGKLRHAVFFFVARADFGRRLGYRGTFPPVAGGLE